MTFQERCKHSQGRCKTTSEEVQNDLRGGAHLSTPPLKIHLDANKSPQLERAYQK
jgi:hypothetical protein